MANASYPTVTALLSAGLETWCHQLLYLRHVYPRETFCNSYFLGVRCKAHRHPSVVSYVSEAVKIAVPALLERVADEFCFEIIDEEKEDQGNQTTGKGREASKTELEGPRTKRFKSIPESEDASSLNIPLTAPALEDQLRAVSYVVLERFTLLFSNWNLLPSVAYVGSSPKTSLPPPEKNFAMLQELERGLRELVLKLSSFDRDTVRPSQTLTFKIQLHLLSADTNDKACCSELQEAIARGRWFRSSGESEAASKEKRPRLPLYQVTAGDYDIAFNMFKRRLCSTVYHD